MAPQPQQSSVRPGPTTSIAPPASKLGQPKATPIIQRELVDANREAKRIVQEAYAEAQRILEDARTQAEETHQRGYDDGYQEGLGAYTEQTTRALLQLRKKEESTEHEFIKLVRVCVEKILGQEIKLNPDAVTGMVRAALQDARQQREIIVRVHPEDAEHLKKDKRRLLEVLARANTIEIREDANVTRGGCVVLTELGMIDASLERQLDALQAAIDEEYRMGNPDGGGGDYDRNEDQEDDPNYGSY
jgi:type III secretion system HrpE/YscL family protein